MMKTKTLSLIALALAALALLLSLVGLLPEKKGNDDYAARVEALERELAAANVRLEALEARGVAGQSGGLADLFVYSWEEKENTLTLTSAYIHVQLFGDTEILRAELVLSHNQAEAARVEIPLEMGEAEGILQATLTDTWFHLPALQEDDTLDIALEVTLADGNTLVSSGCSWYCTAEGLYAVVG